MKKLNLLLLALVATVSTAWAWELKLDVKGAQYVAEAFKTESFYSDQRTDLNLTDGENIITLTSNEEVYIKMKPEAIASLKDDEGYAESTNYNGYYNIYHRSWDPDQIAYTLTAVSEEEYRSESVTVNIDAPELVTITRGSTEIKPTESPVVVAYNPEDETKLTIKARSYNQSIYKVTADGTDITPDGDRYVVNLVDNSGETPVYVKTIDVTAKYPEGFTFKNTITIDGPAEAITKVEVNQAAVENYLSAEGFEVAPDADLRVYFNTTDYKIDEVTVNGTPKTLYGAPALVISQVICNNDIAIKAHKLEAFDAVLDITGAEGINCYLNEVAQTITDGENKIPVKEGAATFRITAKDGYELKTVEYKGNNMIYGSYASVTVSDASPVTIVAVPIIREDRLALYISGLEYAKSTYIDFREGWSLVYDPKVTLVEGYNIVNFRPEDQTLNINSLGSNPVLYVNDAKWEKSISSYVEIDAVNNDVIKLFFFESAGGEVPVYDVTFTKTEDVVLADYDFKKDILATVDAAVSPVKAIGKTNFTIAPVNADSKALVIKVDDTELTPAEDGSFTFDIESNATVSLALKSDGIDSITVENGGADEAVYNLQGIRVADKATVDQLPAGIYISGGKKFIKK